MQKLTRRQFVAAALPIMALPSLAAYAGTPSEGVIPLLREREEFWLQPRFVHLRRVATGEVLTTEYWRDGVLNQEAYLAISWFLRDLRMQSLLERNDPKIRQALRSGALRKEHLTPWMMMSPILLDILYAFSAWLSYQGITDPVDVTSAFRHFFTNTMTEGAAQNSQHPKGGAADIRVHKVSVASLAAFAQWLSGGGVGLYINKQFVHVDHGRVRSWRG